jgi:hypothetical protein
MNLKYNQIKFHLIIYVINGKVIIVLNVQIEHTLIPIKNVRNLIHCVKHLINSMGIV